MASKNSTSAVILENIEVIFKVCGNSGGRSFAAPVLNPGQFDIITQCTVLIPQVYC